MDEKARMPVNTVTSPGQLSEVTGKEVKIKGIWRRFVHLVRLARVPWLGIVIYLGFSVGVIYLALMLPQVQGDFFAGNASVENVITIIGIEIAKTMLVMSMLFVNGIVGARIDRNFRGAIWDKLLRMEPRYFEGIAPNTLLSRMTSDAEAMKEFILNVLVAEVVDVTTLVATIAAMATMDTSLAIIMAVFIPVMMVVAFIVGRIRMKVGNLVKFKMASLTDYLSGQLARILVIKAFNQQDFEAQRGDEEIEAYYIATRKQAIVTCLQYAVNIIISAGPDIALILIGIHMLETRTLTVAGWVAFYAYALEIVTFFTTKGETWVSIKEIQGRLNRLLTLFDEPEEGMLPYLVETVEPGDLCFENVSFCYDNKQILDRASFTLPQNRFTVLTGPSGTGKTTMLKLMEQIYQPQEGNITVAGRCISDIKIDKWRAAVAYIQQDNPLLSGTMRENILYGVEEELSDEQILEAAEKIGVADFITAQPDGLDYQVGQFGSKLSGGQRQKIAMLRTVLQKKQVVLLDEPTASLDVTASVEVVSTILALCQYCTVVVASHDPIVIRASHRAIRFEDGSAALAEGGVFCEE